MYTNYVCRQCTDWAGNTTAYANKRFNADNLRLSNIIQGDNNAYTKCLIVTLNLFSFI